MVHKYPHETALRISPRGWGYFRNIPIGLYADCGVIGYIDFHDEISASFLAKNDQKRDEISRPDNKRTMSN